MTGHRITWFGECPVDGATVRVRPLDVFPCDRCGWMRPPVGFGCTCLGWHDRARRAAEHQAAVRRAAEASVDPAGRGWAA